MIINIRLARSRPIIKNLLGLIGLPSLDWWRRHFRQIPKRFFRLYRVFTIWDWFVLGLMLLLLAIAARSLYLNKRSSQIIFVSQTGGELNIGLPTQPLDFYRPAANNLSEQVINKLIFSPLFRVNEDGSLSPVLAESYSWDNEHKTISIKLKKAFFSNKEPITTKDVKYSLQKIIDDKEIGANIFSETSLEIVDDQNLKISLKEPYAFFEQYLNFPVYSASLSVNTAKSPNSSGPYILTKTIVDKRTDVLKTMEFMARDDYVLGEPGIKKLKLFFYSSQEEAEEAYRAHKVAFLFSKKSNLGGQKSSLFLLKKPVLFLNTANPPFDNESLRKDFLAKKPLSLSAPLKILTIEDTPNIGDLEDFCLSANNQCNLVRLSPSDFLKELAKADYQAVFLEIEEGPGLDFYSYFHSSQVFPKGANFSNFKNKEADQLIEEIRHTFDQNLRQEKQKKLEEMLSNMALMKDFSQNDLYLFTPKDFGGIKNFKISSLSDIFQNVEEWHILVKKEKIRKNY